MKTVLGRASSLLLLFSSGDALNVYVGSGKMSPSPVRRPSRTERSDRHGKTDARGSRTSAHYSKSSRPDTWDAPPLEELARRLMFVRPRKNAASEGQEDDTCTICLCPLRKCKFVLRLTCFHFFHYRCLQSWSAIGRNQSCPLCRAPFRLLEVSKTAPAGKEIK